MINKLFKIIHNRYSIVLKFLFFLRYLFVIFFVSFVLFLTIPKFFDYKKKEDIFKNYLSANYNVRIDKYTEINYYIFPKPKIEIKNAEIKFEEITPFFLTEKLILYPKMLSIYNYSAFESNKLIFKNNNINLEIKQLGNLLKNFLKQKKNFLIKNLDVRLSEKNNPLIRLTDINFSNYGYNRNIFLGKVFNKKFQAEFKDDASFISIKVPDIDFQNIIKFEDINKDSFKGHSKLKFLNTNFKFDFLYSAEKFEILNSYFRSKNLSLRAKSIITIKPYFSSEANLIIDDIKSELIKQLDIKKILESKNIIEKINSKNELIFTSKKFSNSLIDKFNLKLDLAYGQLNYRKEFWVKENFFKCEGLINLFEELPLLDFNCLIISKNKKDLLKIFAIKYKNKHKSVKFRLNVKGNISLINNKINLKSVLSNNYEASKEDLRYIENKFESILFDKDYLNFFDLKKIKKFILEIS